jgi:hypothetical protein
VQGAGRPRHGQQRPHADDRAQPLAQRADGQRVEQGRPPWPAPRGLGGDDRAIPAGQGQLGGAAPARELKRQASPVEPPVEGIQPGPPDGPGAAVAAPAQPRPERHQVVVGFGHAAVVEHEFSQRGAQLWPHEK